MTTLTLVKAPNQISYYAYTSRIDQHMTELHVPVTILFDIAPSSRANAWIKNVFELTNLISYKWQRVGMTGAMCWGDGFESEVVVDFSNGRLI